MHTKKKYQNPLINMYTVDICLLTQHNYHIFNTRKEIKRMHFSCCKSIVLYMLVAIHSLYFLCGELSREGNLTL